VWARRCSALPELLELVLQTSLGGHGLLVARMLGAAVLALGVAWWIARNEPQEQGITRCAAGFIVYNLAVGLLFALHALAAARPAILPWIVGLVHLLAGVGLGVTLLLPPDRSRPETGARNRASGEGTTD